MAKPIPASVRCKLVTADTNQYSSTRLSTNYSTHLVSLIGRINEKISVSLEQVDKVLTAYPDLNTDVCSRNLDALKNLSAPIVTYATTGPRHRPNKARQHLDWHTSQPCNEHVHLTISFCYFLKKMDDIVDGWTYRRTANNLSFMRCKTSLIASTSL